VIRGLVLAAGRGTRLGPLTADRPKCLVPLAGRALLDWQLAALAAAGVGEVAVVGGYHGDRLRRPGVRLLDNPDWARTTMVASLAAAARWLERGPCVVAYGDVVYHPALIARLADARADVALAYDVLWRALWEARFEHPERDAESLRARDGYLIEIGRRGRPLDTIEGQFTGLLRLTPVGWRTLARHLAGSAPGDARALDVTALLGRLLARGVRIGAVPIAGRWCEVDHPGDLEVYERRLAAEGTWSHDWRP